MSAAEPEVEATFSATVILDGEATTVELRVLGGALWYAPAGTRPEDPEWTWRVVRIDSTVRAMTPGELLNWLNDRERKS